MTTAPPYLRRFPCAAALYDGVQVTIRQLSPDDKDALLSFFQGVPEEDRFYLNSDVTAPRVIREFTERIDLSQTIPLVAEREGEIIADATLHRSRRAARRHVGELRIVVAPEYRGKGLGVRLIREFIQIGRDLELRRLVFELVSDRQQPAIEAAQAAGFQLIAVLQGRVIDLNGAERDLVILERAIEDDEEFPHLDI